jgi:hypothetical protein
MTVQEAYIRFLDLVNRNATNNNINVDKPRFVISFNSTAIKYVEWVLDKRDADLIRHIQGLLILEHPLTKSKTEDNYESFTLPSDFIDLANLHAYASKGNCKDQRIQLFEVKSENIEELINDDSNKPSFDYRETFYLAANGAANIYKTDFTISKANLSYYRYPKKVDIAGYIHLDNTASVDIDPEFDDKSVLKILMAMAKAFAASTGDTAQYQLNKDRLFSDI